MKGTILKVDSRDLHYHVFGQTGDFVPESNFGVGMQNIIEASSGIDCTAISDIKVASSQTKETYDELDLWNSTPHSEQGADPRDTLGVMCKRGLVNVRIKLFDTRWVGYFRADTGGMEAFDNCRSAMTSANSSVTVCSPWYRNWNSVPANGVMPQGDTVVANHDWVVVDWKLVNGETMFIVDAHQGYTMLMSREVFNTTLSKFGSASYMPSTLVINDIRSKNFSEAVSDYFINAILKIQALINSLKKPMSTPLINQKIIAWANAIAIGEGAKPELNNPGNLKFSTLTASWGASEGFKALDGGYIARFNSYQKGFDALCNFLILGCKNELKAFHQARTFEAFTKVYAGNPPQPYIDGIAKAIGCSLDTQISTFL